LKQIKSAAVKRGKPQRARALRVSSTDAEKKFWAKVRNRQLAGAKFRRQWPIGSYIADFCCVERHLIVELDGVVQEVLGHLRENDPSPAL
jgi:very-short-patch-repair endonuclease